MDQVRTIVIAPGSARPVHTAAAQLRRSLGADVVEREHVGRVGVGELALVEGPDVERYSSLAGLVAKLPTGSEWELAERVDEGLVLAGCTARNLCHLSLAWLDDPDGWVGRLSTFHIRDRFTMWDNSMNQMYRFSEGFDRAQHLREIARMGHTGVEVNRYAGLQGHHMGVRRFPHDSYPWYLSYAPALDAFVESTLTAGTVPRAELTRNLDDLLEAVELARDYGLQPGFVCYEPRCVTEAVFDRYPELRGSRTDHPGRSLEPRYNLDIANPRVLAHYQEMLTTLMSSVPDLRYFVFWTQDSGSGIPFANKLYAGPNGSFRARAKSVAQMAAEFAGALAQAGRQINPAFEVIMEIGHEYTEQERKDIVSMLPEGVTVSHPVGGSLMEDPSEGNAGQFVQDDRSYGHEPYGLVTVSAGFDAEPIIGVPTPSHLVRKLALTRELKLSRLFTHEGLWSAPQCPYSINQQLYAEFLRDPDVDVSAFCRRTALRWCQGDTERADLLMRAWLVGDRAIGSWRKINWYHGGPGQTQARWLTRPLVPDITILQNWERAAWERALFTLPTDVGRWNIAFESGVRFFSDEDLDATVRAYDDAMIPALEKAVELLNEGFGATGLPVLEDQRDRYRGLLLRSKTDRNLFDAQVAINNYLLGRGEPSGQRARLQDAIRAEVENTQEWISALTGSRTEFFHVSSREETPFLYKTPVEDFELKLDVMPAHIDDEPGPLLAELSTAKASLLFSAVQ